MSKHYFADAFFNNNPKYSWLFCKIKRLLTVRITRYGKSSTFSCWCKNGVHDFIMRKYIAFNLRNRWLKNDRLQIDSIQFNWITGFNIPISFVSFFFRMLNGLNLLDLFVIMKVIRRIWDYWIVINRLHFILTKYILRSKIQL